MVHQKEKKKSAESEVDNRSISYGTQVGKMLDETRKGLALLGKLEQYDFDFKTLCMVKNLYILSRLSYGLESFGPFLSEGQIDLVDLNLKKIARRSLQGIVQPDSIEPWADVPSLEISCGYGHNKTGDADVDRNKFEEYCRDLVPCNSAINTVFSLDCLVSSGVIC